MEASAKLIAVAKEKEDEEAEKRILAIIQQEKDRPSEDASTTS